MTHDFIYKITNDYKVTLEDQLGPENDIIFPNILIQKEKESITFDFYSHTIELSRSTGCFVHFKLNKHALALIVNEDFEHLSFIDVNEKSVTGLFRPDVSDEIQYYNEQEFAVIDYGKVVFTIKDTLITYYTSPVDPDIENNDFSKKKDRLHDHYYYRVFNNPGINQGALLLQKGEEGFENNSLTMFLNRISMIDVNNRTLLLEEMKRDPEFNKALTLIKNQYEQYKQENHYPDENDQEEQEERKFSDEYDLYYTDNNSNTRKNNDSLPELKSLEDYRVKNDTISIISSMKEKIDNYVTYHSLEIGSSLEFLLKISFVIFFFILVSSLL
ncbi:MAG: hypothetical protein HeimC3_52390 [Candidatus Heimdallarchaeota archaeon LC_3]|nr:MAG: hypothetical protein HeimC3_52390 [Candidatus Heimdallarchaeota archaeon LC_3]